MTLYWALAGYRNQWVSINTIESGGLCFHGILEEVNSEYIKLRYFNDDGSENIYFILICTIIRFSPDCSALNLTRLNRCLEISQAEEPAQ